MNEHEFNANVQRELTRIRVELRLQEERLAQQEVRNTRLENRLVKLEQRLADMDARYDRIAHKLTLIMGYIGLNNDNLQELQTGTLTQRFLLSVLGRRDN